MNASNSQESPVKNKPMTRNIEISTKYGPTLLSLSNETRGGTHAEHHGWSPLVVEGTPCRARVGLEIVNGKWMVSRTAAGNESPAARNVHHAGDAALRGVGRYGVLQRKLRQGGDRGQEVDRSFDGQRIDLCIETIMLRRWQK